MGPLQTFGLMTGPLGPLIRALFCSFRERSDRDEFLAAALCGEFDFTFDEGKECVIAAHAYIFTWIGLCSALTDQNVAWNHVLAAILLDAEILRILNRVRSWMNRLISYEP